MAAPPDATMRVGYHGATEVTLRGALMRWLLLLVAVGSFAMVFATHSAGWMALELFIGIVAAIAAVFAFAGARIGDTARQETLSDAELEHLRQTLRAQGAPKGPSMP